MKSDKKAKVFELKKELFFIRTSILMGNFKKNSVLKSKRLELAKIVVSN